MVRVCWGSLGRLAFLAYLVSIFTVRLPAQPDRIAGRIDGTRRAIVQGSVHPKAQRRYDQGLVDPSLQLGYVTLILKPSAGQQAELKRLLEEQRDRSSPNYHRWLTPEQFGDRFGLGAADYAAVVSWLEGEGLHVENAARARNWVTVSGPAERFQHAFGTELHRYLVEGEPHFANATALSVPAALADVVRGVRGLDDFWERADAAKYIGASGAQLLGPDDWAAIYNVAPLYAMGIDGTGQRLAIVGRSDLNQSYVDAFRSQFALPPAQVEMHLVGPDPGVTNAAGEAALDVEWSGAIARNATIVFVYANNFNDAAQAVVDQNLAPVMSQSFGTCEPSSAVANRAMA